MPEALPKSQSSSDEPTLWFQNRGLFSDHFLQARLPQWKEWETDEELATFRKELMSLYESKETILPYLNEAQTEEEFVQPVLDLLGYANSYIVQAPTKVGQQANRPDYALFPDETTKNKAYQKIRDNDYTQCIGIADAKYWERELDLSKFSDRDTFTNQNPSFQIVSYLTGTQQKWGILTNGRLWRLYCIKSHLPLGNYYQVDLVKLLEEAPEEKLKYFYLFFRKAALVQTDGKSFLDHVLEGSNEYAVELEADIKERAYEVVELLCRGFAAGFPHEQLTEPTLNDIYDNSLTLLYRLLFVFYAEARELLPLTSSLSYRDDYSIHKITHDIDEVIRKGQQLTSQLTIYYQRIGSLFGLITTGDPRLGVPEYNGGLFDPAEYPFLEEHAIADAHLAPAIQQLAQVYDKELKRVVAVDYNTLSERHLGSIYEGLLEFKPRLAPYDLVTIKEKGSIKYAPADKHPDKKIAYKKDELYLANDKGERKASGSYYTPEYIVNYIVENTLDPLVKEAQDKLKALKPEVDKAIAGWQKLKEQKQGLEPTDKYDRKISEEHQRLLEPYLSLKILDPAMGSGHFLARATDFLAEAIATDPSIESPTGLTEESELTYYRRRVVESCIYGVDLNPLAVELAKLTLWLGTMAKSKPLSFLNHHLRVGNSLIGVKVAELDEIPKAKGKKGKVIDLSRRPKDQYRLFDQAFITKLGKLLENRAFIAHTPTDKLEDVKNKQAWDKDFEYDIQRFRLLADVWTSSHFENTIAWDDYNKLVDNLQSSEPDWGKLLQAKYVKNALKIKDDKHFFHWELEFPEVFYDEQGNRKTDAGFDAVIGNPPYVTTLSRQEREYFFQSSQTRGRELDTFYLFSEWGINLMRFGGVISLIVPNVFLLQYESEDFRRFLLQYKILSLADLGFTVFGESVVPSAIFVVRKGEAKDSLVRIYEGGDIGTVSKEIPQILFTSFLYSQFNIYLSQQTMQLLSRVRALSITLSKVAESHEGVHSGNIRSKLFNRQGRLPSSKRMLKGSDIERYSFDWDGWFVNYDPNLIERDKGEYASLREQRIFIKNKILTRQTADRVIATYDDCGYYTDNTLHSTQILPGSFLSWYYFLSLLNSTLLTFVYQQETQEYGRTLPQVKIVFLQRLPIRRINFTTAEKERKQLLEQGKGLYQEYLQSQDWDKALAFVAQCLPQKADGTPDTEHERSDVVHDLLAFLAEEMTRLHKEKQTEIKGFLNWLEAYLGVSVEELKNKTKIKEYYKAEVGWEGFRDALEQNRKAVQLSKDIDVSRREPQETIRAEFDPSVAKLRPVLERIKLTDKLIDQIVYKLYGLTNDEIAIVEGQKA